jgi:GTPase SAR1 family protein
MGCGNSSNSIDADALNRSRIIDVGMQEDRRIDAEKVKLLLLGAGESGKSTVFKQLRLLYGEGYTEQEKVHFGVYIKQNIMEAMETLCLAVIKLNSDDPLIKTSEFQTIYPYTDNCIIDNTNNAIKLNMTKKIVRKLPELTQEKAKAIETLWRSASIQNAWRQRAKFQIVESAERFLNKVMDIQLQNDLFLPSDEDILHTRIRTSGIREEKYVFEDKSFHFFDVGGQKNERRKWFNCFQNVHAIIFLVAISEFDQVLWEDNSSNRMLDSIQLFAQIVNDQTFKDAAILLFFNKSDLLREKIKRVNLSKCPEWEDFDGTSSADFEQVTNYFRRKFLHAVDPRMTKSINFYSTQATDSKTMDQVMKATTPVIINRHLMGIGMT